MKKHNTTSKLSSGRLALYAAPWFATQIVFLPLTNFVPGHYASDLGLPLFAVGLVMLASRFLDLLIDPLVGALADRVRTPFGRRKAVALLGAPVMIVGTWLCFAPQGQPTPAYLFLALIILFFGFALVQIPYVSWGAELSGDYDERSRIVGWREGVGVLGTLTAISSPLIAAKLGTPGLGPAMVGIAIGVTLLLPLLLAPALLFVPERDRDEAAAKDTPGANRPSANPLTQVAALFANREAAWFFGASFIAFFGVAPGGAVGFLMMKHLFHAEALYPVLVLSEYLTMLISVPLWAVLAGKLGKHRAMAVALAWMTLWTAPAPLLAGHDPRWIIAASAIRGFGFGAIFVVPYSMVADVIDVDALKFGRARSGVLTALAGVVVKLALMAGVFAATALPALFGFEPARAENSKLAEFSTAVSYAWLSCLFWAAAAPLYWFYPLTRQRQAEVRAALAAREQSAA